MEYFITGRNIKNKMKEFLKKITHDPYTDWFVIFSISMVGIVFGVIWSFFTYKDVTDIPITSSISTSTPGGNIDVKKLDKVSAYYNEKRILFESSYLPKIDVRDPSL